MIIKLNKYSNKYVGEYFILRCGIYGLRVGKIIKNINGSRSRDSCIFTFLFDDQKERIYSGLNIVRNATSKEIEHYELSLQSNKYNL